MCYICLLPPLPYRDIRQAEEWGGKPFLLSSTTSIPASANWSEQSCSRCGLKGGVRFLAMGAARRGGGS